MKLFKQFIIILLVVLFFITFFQNYDKLSKEVSFQFSLYFIRWGTTPFPLWLIILISFAIGYLIAFIFNVSHIVTHKNKIRALNRALKEKDDAIIKQDLDKQNK
ncbi:MAG: LapA family protein [Deltaproteobacteria bacterium]|nr:LapA family protein [Deltaproteobacteria bacterium]